MGKRNRGNRKFRNRVKEERESGTKINHGNAGSYDKIIKENKLFESYYKGTGIVPAEEWNEFIECLQQPLPVTFRITSYKNYTNEILNILKEKHFKYLNAHLLSQQKQEENGENKQGDEEGVAVTEVKPDEFYKCLTWYPNELAWQVNLSRKDVRKNEKFQKFKQFLIDQTESGNISRQEAVSMIPPLLLDVQSHHKILDLCAAPGSKTAQLIELLHQADETNPTPEGFVVANDIDNKRCYMLVHQLKRLESPNFMIVNHDASVLPNIRFQSPDGQLRSIFYDRIVCDVPCSGDGTFRKNVDIWKKWNFAHACNLHSIQVRIAQRAAELLAPDGIMVYSTCSLNPVENEAVVYNLLLKFRGQLELVDARHKLTGMKTSNGICSWKVMSKDGEIYEKNEEVPDKWKNLIREQMFPPTKELAEELKLERCIRVFPHHQNTGGFFIAVIRKIPCLMNDVKPPEAAGSSAPVTTTTTVGQPDVENSNSQDSSSSSSDSQKAEPTEPSGRGMKAAPAKRLKHVYDENPFRFCVDENILQGWPILEEFFGIKKDFPLEQMMMRNRHGENVRNVYFVSKNIHDLVQMNGDRIKFINMGVRLFSKAELRDRNNIELKICQEGIDIVYKYFTKRVLEVHDRDDFLKLISGCMPDIDKFSVDLQTQIKACNGVGSIIMKCHDKNTKYTKDGSSRSAPISFTGWLGKTTIRPFLNLQSRKFLLTLCDIDDEEIDKRCEAVRLQDQTNTAKSVVNSQNIAAAAAAAAAVNEVKTEEKVEQPMT